MASFVRTLLTLACALYLGGAHWMVLQMTAWTGMLVARAQEVGVSLAVETTFDGEHPCGLCTAVEEGRKEERRQQPLHPGFAKLKDAKLIAMNACLAPEPTLVGTIAWPAHDFPAVAHLEAPPTPPPLA